MIIKSEIGMKPIFCASILMVCSLATSVTATVDNARVDLISKYSDVLQKLNVSHHQLINDQVEIETWSGVMGFLEKLRDVPTCGVNAASRLFMTCAELKDDSESTRSLVDGVRTLFAVRMAICETAEGGAKVPPACRDAMLTISPAATKKNLVETDLRIVRSGALPACVRSLQKEHYYWTSYSNYRHDAGVVSDTMHSGVEMQKLIMFYREITDSLAGLVHIVDKHREVSEDWFQDTEIRWQTFTEEQDKAMNGMDQRYQEYSLRALNTFNSIELAASSINATVAGADSSLVETVGKIKTFGFELENVIPVFQANLARLFTDVSSEVVDSVGVQKSELGSAIQDMVDLVVASTFPELVQNLTHQLMRAEEISAFIYQFQHQQVNLTKDLVTTMQDQQMRQRALREASDDIEAKLKHVSLNLENIAGPLRLLGTLSQVYEESQWGIGLVDLALFGLSSTGSALLLLTPGLRIWGIYLYLSYWFFLSLTGCMHYFDPQTTIKNAFPELVDFGGLDLKIAIVAAFVFLLGALCGTICRKGRKVSGKRVHTLQRVESLAQVQYIPGREDHHMMRHTRAGTAPPEL